MNDLLTLSFELQAVLVFGYFGYCIASIGHRSSHTFEDRILQILSFGFISLVLFKFSQWLASLCPLFDGVIILDVVEKLIQAFTMLGFAVLISSIWKTNGKRIFSHALKTFGVTNEDDFPSTVASIIHGHSKMTWDYINLHMKDGRTIQSDMSMLGAGETPGNIPLVDDAGNVAIYVTKIFRSNDEGSESFNPKNDSGSFKLNYYPKEQIESLEICWREPT